MYNVKNIQEPERYPINYDFLSKEEIKKIVSYMNGVQGLADHYYQKYTNELNATIGTDISEEKVSRYLNLYNHTLTSLTGSKNAYAILGIMCEFDWPNHGHRWFLATAKDAEFYNHFIETQHEHEDYINDVLFSTNLLTYGDVGA